jgi:hypothetical protein
MTRTLFLIGAGFNADAACEAGPVYGTSIYIGRHQIDCGYPLAADTARLCFGLAEVPSDKSIEDLFSEALEHDDYSPVEKLAQRLMQADYYLATRLACSEASNCYLAFLNRFAETQFLTFNYDSFVETFLFRLGYWYPHDGYGVPVEAELLPEAAVFADRKSTSLVLHLHGSFCLYTSESETRSDPGDRIEWLVQRERPCYIFDPDSISTIFAPYRRVLPRLGYQPVERRVIAPVPEKAEGLKQPFVRETYAKALGLVRESAALVAIGYSFNSYDRASYHPVLQALCESPDRTLFLVSPHAGKLAEKLRGEYAHLRVEPIEETFKGWAGASFRGVTNVS